MGDFLSKFSSENYEKKTEELDLNKENSEDSIVEQETLLNSADLKDSDEKIEDELAKKENENEEEIVISGDAAIENVIKDKNFSLKKYKKLVTIFVFVLLLTFLVIGGSILKSYVAVPNFKGCGESEVEKWTEANRIILVKKEIYDDEGKIKTVVKQEPGKGKKLKKNSMLTIYLSKGPDPNKIIAIPDLKNKTKVEITKFVEDNKLSNVQYGEDFSETVGVNLYLSHKFDKEGVSDETFKRSDKITFVISVGKKGEFKNIVLPDFSKMTKIQSEIWLKDNGLKWEFGTEESSTIAVGSVTKSVPAAGQRVKGMDLVKIFISKGKPLKVPDFAKLGNNREDPTYLKAIEGFEPIIVDEYSNYEKGRFLSQSVPPGTIVYEDNKNIVVKYSAGKPFIGSFVGNTRKDVDDAIFELNKMGANLTVKINYVDVDDAEAGVVMKQNIKNEYVKKGSALSITIGK